jgi:hypothetical protein
MLFDAASFVCSAISVWLFRKPEPVPARTLEPHISRGIWEGLGASWRAHWPVAHMPQYYDVVRMGDA